MHRFKGRLATAVSALAVLLAAGPAFSAEPKLGEPAPAFELQDLDGNTHALSDFEGQIVVLHFQAVGCPWEKAYQGGLNELANKFSSVEHDGETVKVQFLGINANHNESVDSIRSAKESRSIPYPILKDRGNKVADMYAAKTTPHMYVIDQDGVLRYMGGVEKAPTSPRKVWQSDDQYLSEVLAAITHGKELPYTDTVSKGCGINRK